MSNQVATTRKILSLSFKAEVASDDYGKAYASLLRLFEELRHMGAVQISKFDITAGGEEK